MEERPVKKNGMLGIAVVLAAVVLVAGPASAGSLTFNTWSNNSNYNNFTYSTDNGTVNPNEFPLAEQYMYTWGIAPISLPGQTISSATITFNNISNWDTGGNQDELFIHLLNNATNTGITQLEWTANTNTPAPPFIDHFLPQYYPTTANGIPYNLVGSGLNNLIPNASVNNIVLNDGSYSYTPSVISGTTGPGLPSNFSLTNLTFNQGLGGTGDVGGTFTYTFSLADLTVLAADIASGNDIALGFDPDCHFWNDGISLQINYAPTGGSGTPEPATLTLLGLGLAGLLRKRFNK
jgi:hypothetical protein